MACVRGVEHRLELLESGRHRRWRRCSWGRRSHRATAGPRRCRAGDGSTLHFHTPRTNQYNRQWLGQPWLRAPPSIHIAKPAGLPRSACPGLLQPSPSTSNSSDVALAVPFLARSPRSLNLSRAARTVPGVIKVNHVGVRVRSTAPVAGDGVGKGVSREAAHKNDALVGA